jgi:hypothetical protein
LPVVGAGGLHRDRRGPRLLDPELDIYGLGGIVVLVCIVKKNAIMMVDFAPMLSMMAARRSTPSRDGLSILSDAGRGRAALPAAYRQPARGLDPADSPWQ